MRRGGALWPPAFPIKCCQIAFGGLQTTTQHNTTKPMDTSSNKFKKYCGKIRLLSRIHAEIADELNERREALLVLFFRPEDKYIPESKDPKTLAELIMQGIIKDGGTEEPVPISDEA